MKQDKGMARDLSKTERSIMPDGNFILLLFSKDFIYLIERERTVAGVGAKGEGKADSLLSRQLNTGFNPWNLGS